MGRVLGLGVSPGSLQSGREPRRVRVALRPAGDVRFHESALLGMPLRLSRPPAQFPQQFLARVWRQGFAEVAPCPRTRRSRHGDGECSHVRFPLLSRARRSGMRTASRGCHGDPEPALPNHVQTRRRMRALKHGHEKSERDLPAGIGDPGRCPVRPRRRPWSQGQSRPGGRKRESKRGSR